MNENRNIPEEINEAISENRQPEYDIPYIMQQIEAIRQDTGYLYAAIEQLGHIEGSEKAMAVGEIVTQREKTNQQLIDFYRRTMIEMIPGKAHPKLAMAERLIEEIKTAGIPGVQDKLTETLNNLIENW